MDITSNAYSRPSFYDNCIDSFLTLPCIREIAASPYLPFLGSFYTLSCTYALENILTKERNHIASDPSSLKKTVYFALIEVGYIAIILLGIIETVARAILVPFGIFFNQCTTDIELKKDCDWITKNGTIVTFATTLNTVITLVTHLQTEGALDSTQLQQYLPGLYNLYLRIFSTPEEHVNRLISEERFSDACDLVHQMAETGNTSATHLRNLVERRVGGPSLPSPLPEETPLS